MTHFKEYCKYGFMHRQCRCPGGTKSLVDCDNPTHKEVHRTAVEWSRFHNVTILDPDGWRRGDNVDMHTPITLDDYRDRVMECTIGGLDKDLFSL